MKSHTEPPNEEIEELILAGESELVEFKSTLRYDLRKKAVNKTLEYVIAKTISAFMIVTAETFLLVLMTIKMLWV